MSSQLNYIKTEALVQDLQENPAAVRKDFKIIDVRNADEFNSGHIKGATNFSSELWDDENFVDNFLKENSEVNKFIVHCFMSKQRGPNCATKILLRQLENAKKISSSKVSEM
jgi:rhodanese-related sulfurtransferase